MKSRYRRLAEIVSDPSFSTDKENPLYIEYCSIYMELRPNERHYWKNREGLSVQRRGRYAERVGHSPRRYTRGYAEHTAPDVKRSDFPQGPEGSLLYQKAYQREWQRLNVPKVTERPGYERKYIKTGRYSLSRARRSREAEARHAWLASLSRAYFSRELRAAWSVEGDGQGSLTYRGGPSLKDSIEQGPGPAYTLDTWLLSVVHRGRAEAALDSMPGPVKDVLQERALAVVRGAGAIVPEYLSIIGVFREGDSTLDAESFEYMKEVYSKGRALAAEASSLSREIRRSLVSYWRLCPDTSLDPAALVSGALAVWSVRSALMAARNLSFREGMLYHTLHRRSAWVRAVHKERNESAARMEEDFKALDKLLTAAGMTSREYWTMKNSAGKSSVNVEGTQLCQDPGDTVAAGQLVRKGV